MAQILCQLVTWNIGTKPVKPRYPVICEFTARSKHHIGFLQEIHLIEENAEKKCKFLRGGNYHYSQCSSKPQHAAIHVRKENYEKSVCTCTPIPLFRYAKYVPESEEADRRAGFDESLVLDDMHSRRRISSNIP